MRLLYYTETTGIGGAERYLLDLIRLAPQIASHTTVCVQQFATDRCFRDCCLAIGAEYRPIPWQESSPRWQRFAFAMQLFQMEPASLIHFSLISTACCAEALIAAAVLRKSFVMTEHNVGEEPSGHWKYRHFRRIATQAAAQVIAVSGESRRRLIAHHETAAAKATTIFNGVAARFFADDPSTRAHYRSVLGIDQEESVFIQVAQLVQHKNPMLAVEAFDALPEQVKARSRLIFVGDGPLRELLQKLIAGRHLERHIALLGMREDVCELLKMADVFLLTSGDEGCPFAVLEAMASGLPVVTTAYGGTREVLVDQESGFLVDGSDRYELAKRMAQLVENPSLRRRLGEAARDRAARDFTLETMVRKTHAVYRAAWHAGSAVVQRPLRAVLFP